MGSDDPRDESAQADPSVTVLLRRYAGGQSAAYDELAALLYPELKQMARRRVRVGNGRGIGATTLVQETFLKLLSSGGLTPSDRTQFFGLCATIMRQVIIDDARFALAQKRAAPETEYQPELDRDEQQTTPDFLIAVDAALSRMQAQDSRLAKTFECRYFGGYSIKETAEIVGVSVRTAERLWADARALLAQALGA